MGDGSRAQPSADALRRAPADAWAAIVTAARAALVKRPEGSRTLALRRLSDMPASRLVGGKGRALLVDALVADAALWRAASREIPPEIVELVVSAPAPVIQESVIDRVDQRTQELRERLREARDERDAARRQADGAAARATAAEVGRREAVDSAAALRAELAEVQAELDAAHDATQAAVERERRRAEADKDGLRAELKAARRALEQERAAHQRTRDSKPAAPEPIIRYVSPVSAQPSDGWDPWDDDLAEQAVIPGRPSRIPAGLDPITAEYADALLTKGRRLIVDGHNLLLSTGRGPGEAHRTWLVRLLGRIEQTYAVHALVIFDSPDVAPVVSQGRSNRLVRFAAPDMTADDEIDVEVAMTDADMPILVVTDDAELRARVSRHGADVVGIVPFLAAVG